MAVVAVLALVVLAGCGGLGGTNNADERRPEAGGGAGASGDAEPDGGGDGSGGGSDGDRANDAPSDGQADQESQIDGGTVRASRALVRTGEVELLVDDFDSTRDHLATVARGQGGFVAESTESQHSRDNRTWTTGTLVVRVPNGAFGQTYEAAKGSGEVVSSNSRTEDVSDQLVDLEARISNLESQRERLRTLYDEANDTRAVLRVGERLSDVQGKIERLEAKKRSLEDRVAYSTITVTIREPTPDPRTPTPTPTPTPAPSYHETPLFQAFAASVDGVVVAARTAAVTVAYLLPYLVAFGIPIGLGAAVVLGRDRL